MFYPQYGYPQYWTATLNNFSEIPRFWDTNLVKNKGNIPTAPTKAGFYGRISPPLQSTQEEAVMARKR